MVRSLFLFYAPRKELFCKLSIDRDSCRGRVCASVGSVQEQGNASVLRGGTCVQTRVAGWQGVCRGRGCILGLMLLLCLYACFVSICVAFDLGRFFIAFPLLFLMLNRLFVVIP